MRVQTAVTEPGAEVPRRRLALLARRILAGEKGELEVTLVFTGDATLRRLNRRYRKMDRTTDVLSFLLPAGPHTAAAGEVYISLPQARRQARQIKHSFPSELERLVAHGVLHLVGYDHRRPAETRRMRAREELYLQAVAA